MPNFFFKAKLKVYRAIAVSWTPVPVKSHIVISSLLFLPIRI